MSIPPRTLLRRLAARADAVERSWSITETGTERRVLFFFAATETAIGAVTSAARGLDLPQALIEAWTDALPAADAIGLAVRDDLASVRLYTQYWDVLARRVRAGRTEPAPLYAGFKALPDGSTRIDTYICWPGAPREEYTPEIEDALVSRGVVPEAASRAFAPLTEERCIFTRTKDAGRDSWLATVRRAALSRADVAAALAPALSDAEGGAEIAAVAEKHDMVHIAGGADPLKGRFLTLYFEAGPEEVEAALTPYRG